MGAVMGPMVEGCSGFVEHVDPGRDRHDELGLEVFRREQREKIGLNFLRIDPCERQIEVSGDGLEGKDFIDGLGLNQNFSTLRREFSRWRLIAL